MNELGPKKEVKKKVTELTTFPVPIALQEINENISIFTDTRIKPSKEQIISQAFKLHSQGNIKEAFKSYQDIINQGFKDYRVFSNYGIILKNFGRFKEAELYIRKAIELNADLPMAHYNLGNVLNDLGKSKEAELSIRNAIELNPNFVDAYINLGNILKDQGRLQEAEFSTRQAIYLNPNYANTHLNLGNICIDLGKLDEAELSICEAIKLDPNLAGAYYSISLLNYSKKNQFWREKLFSKKILANKLIKEKVDIYFARVNILHKEKIYKESAKYLSLANNLKLDINQSNANSFIDKSNALLLESDQEELNNKDKRSSYESIFIVGMFRSGSTLLESILSMRNDVYNLGEINILEESFLEFREHKQQLNIAELYKRKVKNRTELNITTNKWLNNFQYAGIIAGNIPHSKIIHCYRNPLDNILSIYRANFSRANDFSSSLVDCAKVYLNHDEVMTEYKKRFRSKIYDLNYDSLVSDPNKEIKRLISWLGWEWKDSFLSPQLNTRSVSTASNVQVRSSINSKSIGGWKNYKEMLKPAIEILAQTDKYRDIMS